MKEHGRPSRPVAVTIIALAVLYVSATGLLRSVQSVLNWNFLAGIIQISPLYLAISGMVWGLAGLWLAWGLWRGMAWSRWFSMVYFLAYLFYFWLDRILIPGSDLRNNNWMFNIGLQLLCLVLLIWTMNRKKSREYFGVANE